MADLIQFPFVRLSYPNIDNPFYSQDIVSANQEALASITAITGLGNSDFAIFSGLNYIEVVSGINYYTAGIFFLNGIWYYQSEDFDEGLRLKANITGIMPYAFTDAVERNLYQVNYGQSTSSPTSASPIFTGNMNAYRMDLKTILEQINDLVLRTTLENVQVPIMSGTVTLDFTNDQAIFYASVTGSSIFITFDFTGAVPGTVIRLKFNFGAGISLSIIIPSGSNIYLESGDPNNAENNLNIMYFLYAGINELDQPEVSYNISQV